MLFFGVANRCEAAVKPSILVLVGALTLAPACTEPLSPSQFVGTYTLTGVNSSRLPVIVAALPDGCTTSFSFGTLSLADGAFSLWYISGFGCPGVGTATSATISFGGSLTVQGRTLVLHAIDPTSPTHAMMEARVTIAGAEADLTVPAGALYVASATTLNFYNGPTLAEFPHSRSN
jgi:hypothetical protein